MINGNPPLMFNNFSNSNEEGSFRSYLIFFDFILGCLFAFLLWLTSETSFSLKLTIAGVGGLLGGVSMRKIRKTENYLRILIFSLPTWIWLFFHFSFPQQALIPLLLMYMSDYGIKKDIDSSSIFSWNSIRSIYLPLLAIPMIVFLVFPSIAGNLLSKTENVPAPELSWQTLNGETIRPEAIEGKVVIIDFWGTWCGPCIAAFPQWQHIYQEFNNHPEVQITMLNTLSNGDTPQRIRSFLEQKDINLPVGLDIHQLADKAQVMSIPNTIIIDKNKQIRYRHTGFLPGEDLYSQIRNQVLTLLAE